MATNKKRRLCDKADTNPQKKRKIGTTQMSKQKKLSPAEARLHLLLEYFIRISKTKLLFPIEIKYIVIDYSLFGYFHPEDHKSIKISNNGLTATNRAKNGYSTILFGFPFKRSPKSIRIKNSKHFKQTYVIHFSIDKYPDSIYGSIAIAFVPLNYSLFNGAPDHLDGTFVLYANGAQYGWLPHRLAQYKREWHDEKEMIIKICLKDHTAKIYLKDHIWDNYIFNVSLPANKNDMSDNNDIIRLAFVLNSPLRNDKFETQITVTDQYWE
eukprot:128545_1